MIVYKLFRLKPTGELGSLFINREMDIPIGKWLIAKNFPTKGFKERFGWHCAPNPIAPHLKLILKSGEKRAWFLCEIKNYERIKRPKSQGDFWYLAKKMKVIKPY